MNIAEDLRKVVGQRLKLLRQEKQLTQEQMGEKLNLSTSAYCKIEYGETDLTLSRLNRIAETLEMSAIELFSKIEGDICSINNYSKVRSIEDLCKLIKVNNLLIDLLFRQMDALYINPKP